MYCHEHSSIYHQTTVRHQLRSFLVISAVHQSELLTVCHLAFEEAQELLIGVSRWSCSIANPQPFIDTVGLELRYWAYPRSTTDGAGIDRHVE